MRVLPRDKPGKIAFCAARLERWAERAEAMGTTPQRVAELAALTEAARVAQAEQYQAQQKARAATAARDRAVAKMADCAASIILQVRAVGHTKPGVFSDTLISSPKAKSPIAPPGRPFDFRTRLCATGAVMFTWKCRQPRGAQGTLYYVWRRVDGGERTYVGWAGERKFTDDTLPTRTASVVYEIHAQRGKVKGPVATFNVNFGTDGKGPVSVITRSQRPPMAA